MRILHYTLGLPPYRSGGLTGYSCSLMKAQAKRGDQVTLLYPYQSLSARSRGRFVHKGKYLNQIEVYKMIGPTIIPLLEGVKNPSDILNSRPYLTAELKNFFDTVRPNVFHIHTWMGMTLEVLAYAHQRGIKIIYSTHDFYGVCPRVNLINDAGKLCEEPIVDCARCNRSSSDRLHLYLRNQPYLLQYKKILKRFIKPSNSSTIAQQVATPAMVNITNEYEKLYLHYQKLYALVDMFHFNSQQTQLIYQKYIPHIKGTVIPITHSGIKDLRAPLTETAQLQLLYIGSQQPYKGLPILYRTLRQLEKNVVLDWNLHIYSNHISPTYQSERIIVRDSFRPQDISDVFKNIHLLIVPSIWYETFGFVVLEAIARGIPVLVSDHVGAKDIINEYDPYFVYKTEEELEEKLTNIIHNRKLLTEFNARILKKPFNYSLEHHANKLEIFYNDVEN